MGGKCFLFSPVIYIVFPLSFFIFLIFSWFPGYLFPLSPTEYPKEYAEKYAEYIVGVLFLLCRRFFLFGFTACNILVKLL